MRSAVAGAVVAAAALATTACASGPTTSLPTSRDATSPAPAIAHVGTSGFIGTDADNIAVVATLTEVLDPATPSSGTAAIPSGARLVAAVFKISDVGIAPTTDAVSDVDLLASDGQTYRPVAVTVTGCSGFGSQPFTVAPGGSTTGCVAFELPRAAAVARVTFSPSDGGAAGVWQVP